jgi:hypothetical protein
MGWIYSVLNLEIAGVFGLCVSSGILKDTKEHDVSETRFVSFLRNVVFLWLLEYLTVDKVQIPSNPEYYTP